MSDYETMIKNLWKLIPFILFLGGTASVAQENEFKGDLNQTYLVNEFKSDPNQTYLVYEVSESQTLWDFSKNLGVRSPSISDFIKKIKSQNSKINNANLIYPGDKIYINEKTINDYVDKKKHFRTRWIEPTEPVRQPSSLQSIISIDTIKSKPSAIFIQPQFLFSRVEATQRGTGATARLVSSVNWALNTEYTWENSVGLSGVSLFLDWVQYAENLGQQIDRNQLLSINLHWQQNLKLFSSWQTYLALGAYQSPYLFTDVSDQLLLKLATQPGLSLGLIKSFYDLKTQVTISGRYLYFGYAGDTFIEDGVGFRLQVTQGVSFQQQEWLLSFWGQQDLLLSEVTEQNRTALGFGIGLSW